MSAPRARNSKDRYSQFINKQAASNLIEAALFASSIGQPLNRFTTIHWEAGGVQTNSPDATGRLLKLARDWLRLKGVEFAHLWVREGGLGIGHHSHILMHLPPYIARQFAAKQRAWLKVCGINFAKGVICSKPIGRSLSHASRNIQYGEYYEDHLMRVVAYLLKGADGEAQRLVGLRYAEPCGLIVGKRCSTSQNIGRAARQRSLNAS
ncbi:MAG: hypothetical protein KUG56_00370 [Kordiimonadaceae bacterium]|nr:hypothetical protein [Kordiimonadaceae bacterium]